MIKDDLMLYNSQENLYIRCESCNKKDHSIYECPKIHFVADREKILKKHCFPLINFNRNISFNRISKRRKIFKNQLNFCKNDSKAFSDNSEEPNITDSQMNLNFKSIRLKIPTIIKEKIPEKNKSVNNLEEIGINHKNHSIIDKNLRKNEEIMKKQSNFNNHKRSSYMQGFSELSTRNKEKLMNKVSNNNIINELNFVNFYRKNKIFKLEDEIGKEFSK